MRTLHSPHPSTVAVDWPRATLQIRYRLSTGPHGACGGHFRPKFLRSEGNRRIYRHRVKATDCRGVRSYASARLAAFPTLWPATPPPQHRRRTGGSRSPRRSCCAISPPSKTRWASSKRGSTTCFASRWPHPWQSLGIGTRWPPTARRPRSLPSPSSHPPAPGNRSPTESWSGHPVRPNGWKLTAQRRCRPDPPAVAAGPPSRASPTPGQATTPSATGT